MRFFSFFCAQNLQFLFYFCPDSNNCIENVEKNESWAPGLREVIHFDNWTLKLFIICINYKKEFIYLCTPFLMVWLSGY